jgi:hypothetical protein
MSSTSITSVPSIVLGVNYANDTKASARETFLNVYRDCTGRFDRLIPEDQQFITLAAEQSPTEPLCEIEQMLREGLLLEQYVGIDTDAKVIIANRLAYPKMKFIHADWMSAILAMEPFTPALIHYDTKNQADSESAIATLASTMELAPKGCFIAANFCTRNPYSGAAISIDIVAERLADYMGTKLNDWDACGQFSYTGDGCAAGMSYLMLRRVA